MAAAKLRKYFNGMHYLEKGDVIVQDGVYGYFHHLSAYRAFSRGKGSLTLRCYEFEEEDLTGKTGFVLADAIKRNEIIRKARDGAVCIPGSIDYKGTRCPVYIDFGKQITEDQARQNYVIQRSKAASARAATGYNPY